jgi:hypothetical protein
MASRTSQVKTWWLLGLTQKAIMNQEIPDGWTDFDQFRIRFVSLANLTGCPFSSDSMAL